jgi:membrane-associated protein
VKLEYYKFVIYSIIGAVLWVNILVLAGYFLVKYIPQTKDYLGYIVIFLIVITTIPFAINAIKKRLRKRVKNTHP